MSKPLFAVPIGPQPFAADICWGSCGLGLVGALTFEGQECIPCDTPVCPYLERQSEKFGEIDGRPVFLRKLIPPPGDSE